MLTESLALFRRRAFLFFTVLTLGLLMTVGVILFAPRKYHSQAKLLLKVGRENVSLDPTVTTTGETAEIHRTRESEIETALAVMKSRELVEKVVDALGEQTILDGTVASASPEAADGNDVAQDADKSESLIRRVRSAIGGMLASIDPVPNRERAIREMRKSMAMDHAKAASVIEVTYQSKSPEAAHLINDTWVKTYLASHSEMNGTQGSKAFFDEQIDELLADLSAARSELQNAKTESGIVTIQGAQEALQNQLATAQGARLRAQADAKATEAKIRAIERQIAGTDSTIKEQSVADNNEAADRMRDRLYELEIEETDLSTRYRDNHPRVVAMRRKLEEAREVFESQRDDALEVTEGVNPLLLTLREQLATERANQVAKQAEIEANEKIVQQLTGDLNRLNAQETRLAAMERDVEVLEGRYRDQYQKLQQARLAEELAQQRISNVNEIQPATLEHRPVSPNKKLVAILGFLGSLMAAAGLVTLMEAGRVVASEHHVPAITPSVHRSASHSQSTAEVAGTHVVADSYDSSPLRTPGELDPAGGIDLEAESSEGIASVPPMDVGLKGQRVVDERNPVAPLELGEDLRQPALSEDFPIEHSREPFSPSSNGSDVDVVS